MRKPKNLLQHQTWVIVVLTGCVLGLLASASRAQILIATEGQAAATIVSNGETRSKTDPAAGRRGFRPYQQ